MNPDQGTAPRANYETAPATRPDGFADVMPVRQEIVTPVPAARRDYASEVVTDPGSTPTQFAIQPSPSPETYTPTGINQAIAQTQPVPLAPAPKPEPDNSLELQAPEIEVDEPVATADTAVSMRELKHRSPWRPNRVAFVLTGMVLAIAAVASGGFLYFSAKSPTPRSNKTAEFAVGSVSLGNIDQAAARLEASKADTLEVNGRLYANQGIVLAPSSTPGSPVNGQLYLNRDDGRVYYFSRGQFSSLATSREVAALEAQQATSTLSPDEFIQNGDTPQAASFNITGNGRVGGVMTAASFSGSGAGLTALNATNISAGSLDDARLSTNVTLQGNTFNGASQLVQLTSTGLLPVLNGSNLTSLNASNISSGTLSDARLSGNVALLDASQIFSGANTFRSAANSSAAFRVQNSGSGTIFNVDTLNNFVGIGTGGAGYKLDVQGGDINTSGVYRVNGGQISSANLSNDSSLAKVNASNTFSASNTFATTVSIQGAGSLTLGSASNVGSIIFRDGATANTGTLGLAGSLAANANYSLPVGAGTQTLCTVQLGNCAGSGSGITGSGTANKLAKFNAAQNITDSSITDTGTLVTVATGQLIQGSAGLTIGVANSVTGKLVLHNSGNANTVTLQSGSSGSNLVFNLPAADGNANDCLKTNGTGQWTFAACTGGPGGGVTSVNSLSGVISIAGTTNQVNVASGGSTITLSTPQDINTNSSVAFRRLTVTGTATADDLLVGDAITGSTGKLLDLKVNGVSQATIDSSGNLNVVGQYRVNGLQLASSGLSDGSNLAKLNAANTFSGSFVHQRSANSTTAFQIQNATGTSNLFVADTVNNRIGVGAASPGFALDVVGDINSSGVYRINGVTICTATGCSASAGSSSYIQNSLTTQTSANLNIQSAGTTNVTAVLRQNASQTADLIQFQDSTGVIMTAIQADGKLVFGPSGAQDANLYRSATDTLRTDDDLFVTGRNAGSEALKVGGVHSSPNRYFTVDNAGRGTFRMDDNSSANNITLTNAGLTAANQGTGIQFNLGSGNSAVQGGSIRLLSEDTYSAGANRDSYLQFSTSLDGTVSEAARLTSNGRLGVGVTSPQGKLDVAVTADTLANVQANTASNAMVFTSTYGTGTSTQGGVVWNTTDNSNGKPKAGIFMQATPSGSYMLFGTSNNYGLGMTNIALTIRYDGNIGLGTTNPGYKLEVQGAGYFNGNLTTIGNLYSPLWYDSNDNNYYVNPNGVSVFSDVRSTIFYDYNNTSYYVDPSSNTYINALQTNNTLLGWPGYNGVAQAYGHYIWPGRNDGSGGYWQQSWYLASHSSYGLYTNTNLYLAGALYPQGNINFGASNPTISASSYTVFPGGIYVSGGTLYAENTIMARRGLQNDSGNNGGALMLYGNVGMPGITGSGGTSLCQNIYSTINQCSSNARLKHDINQLSAEQQDQVLNEVLNTPIFHYRWNPDQDDPNIVHTGVIAEYLPAGVTNGYNNQGDVKVDWFSLYGYLWTGEQALNRKIESLLQGKTVFSALNVSGPSLLDDLEVTGLATVEDLRVIGSAEFEGDISVGGHVITEGNLPRVELQAAAGVSDANKQNPQDAVITIEGNDTAGTITITTGDTAVTAGDLARITFSKQYGKTPRVILSPYSATAAALRAYQGRTTTHEFLWSALDAPTPNTTYKYNYFITE